MQIETKTPFFPSSFNHRLDRARAVVVLIRSEAAQGVRARAPAPAHAQVVRLEGLAFAGYDEGAVAVVVGRAAGVGRGEGFEPGSRGALFDWEG